ncbi:hypothetical protein Ancab_007036 [Ancistrocladus abbreviatus]
MGDFPEGAQNLAQLILRCIEDDPRNRPPMSEVLALLEGISAIRMDPKKAIKPRPSPLHPRAQARDQHQPVEAHRLPFPDKGRAHHRPMDPNRSLFRDRPGNSGPPNRAYH